MSVDIKMTIAVYLFAPNRLPETFPSSLMVNLGNHLIFAALLPIPRQLDQPLKAYQFQHPLSANTIKVARG